jgi:hypothetical protein
MSYQPFYIANYDENGGLDQHYESFLIPEKAFPVLEDAYAWRGRIKRRMGFSHLGRLRRVLTIAAMGNISSAGAGTFDFNIFTGMGILATEPYAQLQPGTALAPITINIGAPISQDLVDNTGTGTMTVVGIGSITAATISYATGIVSITFSGAIGVSAATITGAYFPGLPVMGLPRQETDLINQELLIAFDTKYAYRLNLGQFERLGTAAWNGSDSDFFWCTNYYRNTTGKLLWATNFHRGAVNDPIYYWDTAVWTAFRPILRADNQVNPAMLLQARVLLPYKDHLIALNTWEGNDTLGTGTQFTNRIRFSWNGDPTIIGTLSVAPAPLAWVTTGAWADDIPGYGGYLDLPTAEQIITAEFIKDTLIVKCERSSWKLIPTGNKALPFLAEKINTELGAESTFSMVPFDRGVFTVGNYGITTDDSVNVTRIDQKIPDTVFDFNNDNDGTKRVHGLRDYPNELVYWTYPSSDTTAKFPNKMLVFNYRNDTYSIFNDSFTCLGYYQRTSDLTWADLTYLTWEEWIDKWNSGAAQSEYPDIVAGNQQGFVSVLNQDVYNDASLAITIIDSGASPAIFTVPAHNLQTGQFVEVTGVISGAVPDYATALNGIIFQVNKLTDNTFNLLDPLGNLVDFAGVAGTYIGEGKLTVLNNINITTKIFAPFYEVGGQARLAYIDFLFDRTDNGALTANVFIDEDKTIPINDPTITSGLSGNLGSNILLTQPEDLTIIPFQINQAKIWHRLYVQTICQNFSIVMKMNDEQMFSKTINANDIVLHAMVLYISKNARLIQ